MYALDHQAHGRSEALYNLPGYIDNFEDFVDDIILYTKLVKSAEKVFPFK